MPDESIEYSGALSVTKPVFQLTQAAGLDYQYRFGRPHSTLLCRSQDCAETATSVLANPRGDVLIIR